MGWLRWNRSLVLMWVGIIALSGVLAFRVQSMLEARGDRQDERGAVDELRRRARPPESEPVAEAVTQVEMRSYERGQCVTWDQSGGLVRPKVVNCDEPHLLEVIQKLGVDAGADAPYPSEAEWDELYEQLCRPVAREYLDGRLDPYGHLAPGGLHPTEDVWGSGIREFWCGLQSGVDLADGRTQLSTITGRAAKIDQSWLPRVDSCLEMSSTSVVEVPCTGPHRLVVVGHLDLSSLAERPRDIDIRVRCEAAFTPAGDMGNDQITYVGFDPESWAAGSRRGPCVRGAWSEADGGLPDVRPGRSALLLSSAPYPGSSAGRSVVRRSDSIRLPSRSD